MNIKDFIDYIITFNNIDDILDNCSEPKVQTGFASKIQSEKGLLDRPKELLELISDCLKPKAIEKKTFGEVFTPMDFINDKMLFDIEEYWMKNIMKIETKITDKDKDKDKDKEIEKNINDELNDFKVSKKKKLKTKKIINDELNETKEKKEKKEKKPNNNEI